jgi:hypothetical protein
MAGLYLAGHWCALLVLMMGVVKEKGGGLEVTRGKERGGS